jgi:hypothetical protein
MAGAPVLRVIKGDASPEEIAALLAVLTATAAPGAGQHGRPPRPVWSDRTALLRQPFGHGPGGWRRNARLGIV